VIFKLSDRFHSLSTPRNRDPENLAALAGYA
jgi:hypothetical protein